MTDTLASLPLDTINPGLFGRPNFEQKLINKAPRTINDDSVCESNSGESGSNAFASIRSLSTPKAALNGTASDTLAIRKSRCSTMGKEAERFENYGLTCAVSLKMSSMGPKSRARMESESGLNRLSPEEESWLISTTGLRPTRTSLIL